MGKRNDSIQTDSLLDNKILRGFGFLEASNN